PVQPPPCPSRPSLLLPPPSATLFPYTRSSDLLTHARLARTSKTPGRTQLINFFALDDTHRLVDLPGYGYAKVPLELKEHWKKHLDAYLTQRDSLAGVVLVMDIRHPLSVFDRMMLDWANVAGLPAHILLS